MRRALAMLAAVACAVGLTAAPIAPAVADSAGTSGTGWSATITVPDVVWTGLACQKVPFTVRIEGAVIEWAAYVEAARIPAKRAQLKRTVQGSGPGEVTTTFTRKLCPTPKTIGQYVAAAAVGVMGPGFAEPEVRVVAVNFTVGPAAPVARVKTNRGASKMRVDVNPNLGSKYWRFTVEKKDGDTWIPLKTYKTLGAKETRNINLPAGTYRVHVLPKYGFTEAWSNEVTLRK